MNLSRAQLNFDNRLPPDDSMREAAIGALTEQLTADMWQDLEYLSDAINNAAYTIGHYREKSGSHPMTVTFLTLLRDGSDDAELGRMLRLAAKDYISGMANDEAEERLGE